MRPHILNLIEIQSYVLLVYQLFFIFGRLFHMYTVNLEPHSDSQQNVVTLHQTHADRASDPWALLRYHLPQRLYLINE